MLIWYVVIWVTSILLSLSLTALLLYINHDKSCQQLKKKRRKKFVFLDYLISFCFFLLSSLFPPHFPSLIQPFRCSFYFLLMNHQNQQIMLFNICYRKRPRTILLSFNKGYVSLISTLTLLMSMSCKHIILFYFFIIIFNFEKLNRLE